MVTAETATVLPFLVLITFALAWMVSVGIGQVRCLDAAREAARIAARGDGTAAAVAVATRVAPTGAVVSVHQGAEAVEVQVTVDRAAPLPVLGDALAVAISATATAAVEDGDAADGAP
jgi:hypothetical protein